MEHPHAAGAAVRLPWRRCDSSARNCGQNLKPKSQRGGRYRRIGSKLYLRVIYLIKFYSYKMRLSRVRRTEASRAGLWRLGRPVSSSGEKLPSGKKGQSLLT